MRTYIIFTTQVTTMGGAQMYTANKVSFLKSKGWNVHVFFPKSKGDVMIPALKEYKDNVILEMGIQLRFLTNTMKRKIYRKLETYCKEAEELVMESQIITQSFLVEEIAEHFGARHIINTIDERILFSYEGQNKFFEYKLRRWEFQNAGERRLKQTFGSDYKEEFLAYKNEMVFKCTNVVSEEESRQYTFTTADFTILSIGRLDKSYIMPMTKELRKFAENNAEKRLNIIYIGGSFVGSGCEENIRKEFGEQKNVNLYMLGFTFPVPKSIIDITNVAIDSSNSVNVTSDMDVPTIAVDNRDNMAIGVFGYDTNNKLFRSSEPAIPISSLLEAVLLRKLYPKRGFMTNFMDDVNEAFERELAFIEKSRGNTGYYDVESLISLKIRIISRLVWWKYMIIDPARLDPRKRINN